MKVILSVAGLYNYDHNLFDALTIPDGMDKSIAIDRILMDCSELPTVYPDVDLFKRFLAKWSSGKLLQWTRLWNAANKEYDIIRNYDRIEDETLSGSGTRSNEGWDQRTIDGETTRTNTGTVTDAGTHSDEDVNKVTGFNSTTLVTSDTHANEGETGNTRTDDLTEETTEDVNDTMHRSGSESVSNSQTRALHTYGNIGVTTSQQMIESELELVEKLDVYGVIVSDFIDAFCVGVY